MVNMYKMKVYGALVMSPLITVISFFVVLQFYGFLWSLGGMFAGVLLSVLISKLMINNPFTLMLEGKGIIAHNLDSTGIIRPFVTAVQSPYIRNDKEGVNDVFDRNAVYQYAAPVKNRKPLEMLDNGSVRLTLDKTQMVNVLKSEEFTTVELDPTTFNITETPRKGLFGFMKPKIVRVELTPLAIAKIKEQTEDKITIIEMDEREYNAARFALFHYPALIWNDQIKSMLTKDFLSNQEKEAFAEHNVLYLNRKMEELTSAIRDFGRYVVELTKPKESWLKSKWAWVVIAIVVVILAAMFAPSVIDAIKGTTGSGAGGAIVAAKNAVTNMGGGTITPIG